MGTATLRPDLVRFVRLVRINLHRTIPHLEPESQPARAFNSSFAAFTNLPAQASGASRSFRSLFAFFYDATGQSLGSLPLSRTLSSRHMADAAQRSQKHQAYSPRNASIGSTPAARLAGTAAASRATTPSTAVVVPRTSRSHSLTP